MKQIPFNTETTQTIVDQFNRDGWIHLPGVLTGEEIAALTEGIDAVFDDPNAEETNNVYDAFSAVRLFERDAMFRDMLVREPVISLAEKLLGDDCHLIADGVVRNRPGEAVNHWHTDDLLIFPLPDEIPHHDPRMNIPNMIINFQFMLTDVPTIEYGPTEVVPGSHYSGRRPENSGDAPQFKGQGPVPILCEAGDLYLQHSQTWHRGAKNTSTRTRYLYQIAYGKRCMSQRFYPFLNYHMPEHVLEGASERLLRVLGKHPKGSYG